MGIRFDASGDSLSRARLAGAKTVMAWVYISTDRNDYTVFFGLGSNELIGTGSDGTTLLHYDGVVERTGSALSTGTWYHIAYTSIGDDVGNGFTVYLNGASSITSTGRAATSAGTNMYLGNDQYSEWLNGRLAHVKVWNAALTVDEIAAEMYSFRPQRLASLWAWLPMIDTGTNRSSEWSGSGNTWTANGTLADEDGPAVVANNLPFWAVPWVVAASAGGELTGAGAATLAGITSAGAGAISSAELTGAGAATLAGITSSAAATIPLTGVGAATLAGIDSPQPHALRFYGDGTAQNDRARIELDSPANPPIDVGAGNFTYETWLRCAYADNDSASPSDVRYTNIALDRDIYGHVRGFVPLGLTRVSGKLVACFGAAGAGLTWATIAGTVHIGDGLWHHVAIVRNQSTGNVTIYIDGAADASGSYSTGDLSYPDGERPTEGQDNPYLVVGAEKHSLGPAYNGELWQLRVSDTARYTGSFTPARQLLPDGDTAALFPMDEGSGTTARDISGLTGAENMELLIGGTPAGPAWVALPAAQIAVTAAGAATLAGITGASAANIPLTAAGAATLGGITSEGAATIPIVATAAATLAGITGAGAAVIGSAPMEATGAATLAGIAGNATGQIALDGEAAATLAGITGNAAATIQLAGQGAATLAGIDSAGAASIPLDGDAAATLAGVTGTAAATIPIVAAGAATLAAMTSAGDGVIGSVPLTGAGAATFAGVTGSAAAQIALDGDGAATIGAMTGTAAATIPLTAAGAATLAEIAGAGTAIILLAGQGAATLAGITGAGSASSLSPLTGDGAATLAPITSAGAAVLLDPLTGAGAATFAGVTGSGVAVTILAQLIYVLGAIAGGAATGTITGGRTTGAATGGRVTGAIRTLGKTGG